MFEARPKYDSIARQANGARSNGEWSGEGDLPDKEKRDQLAQFFRSVDFTQIAVRTSRPRHGGSQFRPDQPVTDGKDRAQNPAQHGLWAAHGADDEGNSDERPHADHVDHVQRGGGAEADAADELVVGLWSLVGCRWSVGESPNRYYYGIWLTTSDQRLVTTFMSCVQQIYKQPNCSRHPCWQLAEECVSREDVSAFSILCPQKPAF